MNTFTYDACLAKDLALVQEAYATHNCDRSKIKLAFDTIYKLWEATGKQPVQCEARSAQALDLPNRGSLVEVLLRRMFGKMARAKSSGKGFDCYYDGHRYEIKWSMGRAYRATGLTDSERKAYGVLMVTPCGVFAVEQATISQYGLLKNVGKQRTAINTNVMSWNVQDYYDAGLLPLDEFAHFFN